MSVCRCDWCEEPGMEWKCRVRRQEDKDKELLAETQRKDPVAALNDLVGFQRARIKELEAQVAELTKKKPAPIKGDGPSKKWAGCGCDSCNSPDVPYEYG